MRLLYVLLIYLVAPLVIAHEAWKALFNPEYRGRLRQRLGFVQQAVRPVTDLVETRRRALAQPKAFVVCVDPPAAYLAEQ